jgi:hypothetical protein
MNSDIGSPSPNLPTEARLTLSRSTKLPYFPFIVEYFQRAAKSSTSKSPFELMSRIEFKDPSTEIQFSDKDFDRFNETVEEATQSLYPLIAKNGMDWMYANCSTTAQRGALDWWKKFRDATLPVFTELYESVAAGNESQRSIDSNSKADYREGLEKELAELRDSELWQAGKTVRSLRPENQPAPVAG